MTRTAEELLHDLSVRIYDDPSLVGLRDSGAVADLRQPLHVVMLLLDFDTEVAMSGIVDFLGNSTGRYAKETADALEIVGCRSDAAALREILQAASDAGLTHEAVQADMTHLDPFAVTSFGQLHGSKWDDAAAAIQTLAQRVDFERIWSQVAIYMEHHRAAFEEALPRITEPGGG